MATITTTLTDGTVYSRKTSAAFTYAVEVADTVGKERAFLEGKLKQVDRLVQVRLEQGEPETSAQYAAEAKEMRETLEALANVSDDEVYRYYIIRESSTLEAANKAANSFRAKGTYCSVKVLPLERS